MNDLEKTIPYKPGPAEIAYFRSLGKKTITFDTIHEDEEEVAPEAIKAEDSDTRPAGRTVAKKSVGMMNQDKA
jgi:copper chaperone CopZ